MGYAGNHHPAFIVPTLVADKADKVKNTHGFLMIFLIEISVDFENGED